MTPSNVVAMYNEFRKPTQKVTNASTKKQYISPNTSIKNKPVQTELQFGEPIPTKVTSNKRPYISPSISTKATANKIPTQAEIQFGEIPYNKRPYIEPVTTKRYIQETDGHSIKYQQPTQEVVNTAGVDVFNQTKQQLLNNRTRKPYISPNAKVLPQNDAAKIIYNMKFNPKEYANGIINQPRFNIPERPIASNFTPKLNYNAESTIGKVPQAKTIQYVKTDQPNVKTISWEEALKQKKVKPSSNKKVRTAKPKKVAKKYLGGTLTNNRFEKWINL